MDKQFAIGVGITSACNMNCPFCYSANRRSVCTELPIEQWVDFFTGNSELIKSVNYGTSENTLCNDWFLLVESLHNKDNKIGQALTTNGTLADIIARDSTKRDIIDESITDIDVSLDFATEQQHNKFRGNPRAYKMAKDTLAYCQDMGKNTTIVVMGIEATLALSNLEGIFSIASAYNALVRINLYRSVNKDNKLVPPSFGTVLKTLDWIAEHHEICALSDPLFAACFTLKDTYEDSSGKYSLRILPDGGIYPSTYLIDSSYCLGNIKTTIRLDEILNRDILQTMVGVIPDECLSCPIVARCCGGALDRRILTYGTAKRRDPYCPFDNQQVPGCRNYSIAGNPFSSIHDGYLPTLFFKS